MPEPLHRITYDATIDDAVDVAFRLAARTQAFRKQLRLNVIIAGMFGGVSFLGAWTYYGSWPAGLNLVIAVAGAVAFGVISRVCSSTSSSRKCTSSTGR